MPDFQFIKVIEADRSARLVLARPPVNVLNIAMLQEMNACLQTLATRAGLCALVIEAEGSVFSAGVDVPEHQEKTVRQMLETFHQTVRLLHSFPAPLVAAVHGGVFGGGLELAISSDITLAADDLQIGVPEITLGVYPPVAMVLLARVIGVNRAAELILTGRILNADEALRIGLVNHVYKSTSFREQVTGFVDRLTQLSSFSLRHARRAFRQAAIPDFEERLRQTELIYLRELMAGSDPAEGLRAFMEKRPPRWSDR